MPLKSEIQNPEIFEKPFLKDRAAKLSLMKLSAPNSIPGTVATKLSRRI